jgi:oxygen-independent coproporphyrinogen-3 oxidase
MEVQHISAYCLTVENNTPIARALTSGQLPRIDDDVAADMMDATVNILDSAGYERYEISNYARKGFRSIHNQAYWNYDSYIGAGAGAVGFTGYERYMNIKDDIGYIESWENGIVPANSIEILTEKERMSEAAFLGLRTGDGINIDLWEKRFQVSFMGVYGDAVKGIISRGFGVIDEVNNPSHGRSLRLTEAGMAIANTIALDFLL